MKMSRILLIGLLVLGGRILGWGQPTCDELGDPKIQKRLEEVINRWKDFSKQNPQPDNKAAYQLFVSLQDYAVPDQTEAGLKKALNILTKLEKYGLGGKKANGYILRKEMKGICNRCIKSIHQAKEESGDKVNTVVDAEPVNDQTTVVPRPPKKDNETNNMEWVLGILATLFIGLLVLANRHRITGMISKAKSQYSAQFAGSNSHEPKATDSHFSETRTTDTFLTQENEHINALNRQLLLFQTRLNDVELRVSTLSTQLQKVEKNLQDISRLTDPSPVKGQQAVAGRETQKEPNNFTNFVSQPDVFYMASPSPDGSFSIGNQSLICRPGQSIYKFVVMSDNPNRAEFQLIDSPETLPRILNLIETYVEPVCTSVNGYVSDAKRIFTTNPGLAERHKDRWVVKDKAEIKYA